MTAPTWTEPDSSGILRLFYDSGMAHGCPIADDLLITARHVAVTAQGRENVKRYVVWSDRDGNTGSATTEDFDMRRDLATMRSDRPFRKVYQVASEPPQDGERLTMVGYNFRDGLAPKIATVKVLRSISAHLVLSEGGEKGFSGSCLLNSKSQAVGIYVWQIQKDELHPVYGSAPLIVGDWQQVDWTPSRKPAVLWWP